MTIDDRTGAEIAAAARGQGHLISRADALKKMRTHMLESYTREQLLCAFDPAPGWEKRRNYEIEMDLEKMFGGDWIVNEWCPFDGRFCMAADLTPEERDG